MNRLSSRCTDRLGDSTELERCAYNAAFALSGLDWHWSQERFCSLLKIAGERHRISWFAEHVEEQPIPSSRADAILWRKEQMLKTLLDGKDANGEGTPYFIGSRAA